MDTVNLKTQFDEIFKKVEQMVGNYLIENNRGEKMAIAALLTEVNMLRTLVFDAMEFVEDEAWLDRAEDALQIPEHAVLTSDEE